MKRRNFHVLKKDFRAALPALALYLGGVGVVQGMLAQVVLPGRGIWLQLPCWVLGWWIYHERLREDSPTGWDLHWVASRPVEPRHLLSAKIGFLVLGILAPVVLFRLGYALILGFGLIAGALSALTSTAVPLLGAYLLLLRERYGLQVSHHVAITGCLILVLVLPGFRGAPRRETESIPIRSIAEVDTPPHPADIIDPWLVTSLPPGRMLADHEIFRSSRFGGVPYRQHSRLYLQNAWFWHVHRRYPDRSVKTTISPRIASGRTEKRYTTRVNGEIVEGFRETSIPREFQGMTHAWQSLISYRIFEVSFVWSGPLAFGVDTVDHHIRGRFEADGSGRITLSLLGSPFLPAKGGKPYNHCFEAGHAAFLVESGPDSMLLVRYTEGGGMDDGVETLESGILSPSRKYRMSFLDPRPYFPPDARLRITVLGATLDGEQKRMEKTLEIPQRDAHRERLLARAVQGDHEAERNYAYAGSGSDSPTSRRSSGSTGEYGQELDAQLRDRLWIELSDPRRSMSRKNKPVWDELRTRFDPDDPKHIQAVLSRLMAHPYLLYWLPEDERDRGRDRIHEAMKTTLVTNPMAVLHLVDSEAIGLLPNLGWSFEFSNRVHRLVTDADAYATRYESLDGATTIRCPVRYLGLVPETERRGVWERTWKKVRLEESMKGLPYTPPGYFLEALRRNSPQAVEAACLYLRKQPKKLFQRKGWMKKYLDLEQTNRDIDRLVKQLRERFPRPGTDGEFLDWFLREGFRVGETEIQK